MSERHVKSVFLLALVATLAVACTSDTTSKASVLVAGGEGEPAKLAPGEPLQWPVEDRSAYVAILTGTVVDGDTPYSAELVRVIDAPIHTDLDPTDDGAEQWITRAQVVDADGNVLWQDRANTMFQLIEYLGVILRETSVIQLNTRQVFTFVRNNYPSLLEFPVEVPTGIEGGVTYRLMVPNAETGELYEAFSASIDDLLGQATPPEVEGEVIDLIVTGPSEDRLDVVILGDGYIESGRNEFELDAQAVADRLVTTPPFDKHADMINVRAVWTPSTERGAGYDCTGNLSRDRFCRNDFKDTVFGTVFVLTALADQLNIDLQGASDRVAMPLEIARLYDVAAQADYDEVLLISDTNRRSGFAGIYAAIVTAFDTRVTFPDVAVHELGHSFALLGDEYEVEGDPCLYNEPRIPLPVNIAEVVDRSELKWASWVPEDTPLPTPESQARDYPVGAYSGAYNCEFLYRPARICKMVVSTEDFCPVCSEQVSRRFYAYVDPVMQDASPAVATANEDGSVEFAVRPFGDANVRWILDGEVVGEDASITITAKQLGDSSTLEVQVEESRGFIRDRQDREVMQFSWTLGASD